MNRNDNSDEMNSAISRLTAAGIRYQQTSEFQIKVGLYNFYPDTGTITMDGNRTRLTEVGLDHFLTLLNKVRKPNPRSFNRPYANKNAQTEQSHPGEFKISEATTDGKPLSPESEDARPGDSEVVYSLRPGSRRRYF